MAVASENYNDMLRIYGNASMIDAAKDALADFNFTGNPEVDSVALQEIKDSRKLKATFLYDGRTIYPFASLVREIKRMIESDSIRNISKTCYQFFSMNFDIAHYDIYGYIDYYNGSFSKLYEETLKYAWERHYYIASTRRIIDACLEYMKEKNSEAKEKEKARIKEPACTENSFVTKDNNCTMRGQSDVFFSLFGSTDKNESLERKKTRRKKSESTQPTLLDLLAEFAG